MEWRGSNCGESGAKAELATTRAQWDDLWRRIGQPPPKADLRRHVALAVFLGTRPTGGWSVEFLDPAPDGAHIVLRYRAKGPGPGDFVTQALTQPWAVRLYPKSASPMRAEEAR